MSLVEIEKMHILRVLKDCNNNITKAIRRLGISKMTLYRRLKEYDQIITKVKPLNQVEKEHILSVLEDCEFDVKETSRRLGVSKGVVYHRLDKYDPHWVERKRKFIREQRFKEGR